MLSSTFYTLAWTLCVLPIEALWFHRGHPRLLSAVNDTRDGDSGPTNHKAVGFTPSHCAASSAPTIYEPLFPFVRVIKSVPCPSYVMGSVHGSLLHRLIYSHFLAFGPDLTLIYTLLHTHGLTIRDKPAVHTFCFSMRVPIKRSCSLLSRTSC